MSDLQYDFGDDKEGIEQSETQWKDCAVGKRVAYDIGIVRKVQPAEAMCDLVENEYIKRLLRNASDSYIRFALSTGHYADKIKEEKDKDDKNFRKWGTEESRKISGCIF